MIWIIPQNFAGFVQRTEALQIHVNHMIRNVLFFSIIEALKTAMSLCETVKIILFLFNSFQISKEKVNEARKMNAYYNLYFSLMN